MSGIELQGVDQMLDDIRRKLGNASARLENRGLRKAGEPIAEEMRSRAPRSDTPRQAKPSQPSQSWRTGLHGADNIKLSRIMRKDGQKYILIGIQRGDMSRYFYLKFFEFGTSKLDKQPWAEPAFHARKKEALQTLADEYRKGLRS